MSKTISLGFIGELDWSDWFYGLIAAIIGGGAASVASGFSLMAIDPEHFNAANPGPLVKAMLAMFMVNGILNGFAFLRNKPVPVVKEVTHTVQQITVKGKPPLTTVTTTTSEKTTEAVCATPSAPSMPDAPTTPAAPQ